ncbi:MAG: PP2C family protein-serine/threonine phosphatase [Candidatus Gracilibacteria bacterium]|nr:PP2C family protein-serine/threonine phosphatase [Candidatus Gracilibacteria bacterium]
MKSFYNIFKIILLLSLAINPMTFMILELYFKETGLTIKIFIFLVITIISFFIIIYLVKKFYHDPIKKLELTIKHFLVGDLKDSEIVFGKTPNIHLNYALIFFSKTLNTLKNIKDEFIHGKEIKGEVELGKEIQGKMLTKKLIEVPSLDIIARSKPAGEIGGDSYDIIEQGDNYYIYVGDATGHGVGAGFIMIMVNALVSGFSKVYKSGATVLVKTNEVLKPRVKANLLMSMLLVRWDEKEKRLFMTGAGHEYLMVYKQSSKKTFRIKSGGVAIGMIKDISKILKEQEIKFEKGDIIVLYSDGITEAINKPRRDGTEELFGENRLEESINQAPNMKDKEYKSARSIFNNITINLSKFMGYKHTQLDDVTLAVIQYKTDDFDKNNDFDEIISKDFITEWNW